MGKKAVTHGYAGNETEGKRDKGIVVEEDRMSHVADSIKKKADHTASRKEISV